MGGPVARRRAAAVLSRRRSPRSSSTAGPAPRCRPGAWPAAAPLPEQPVEDLVNYLKSIQLTPEEAQEAQHRAGSKDQGRRTPGSPRARRCSWSTAPAATPRAGPTAIRRSWAGAAPSGRNLTDGVTCGSSRPLTGGWPKHVEFVTTGSDFQKHYGSQGIGSGRMPGFGQILTRRADRQDRHLRARSLAEGAGERHVRSGSWLRRREGAPRPGRGAPRLRHRRLLRRPLLRVDLSGAGHRRRQPARLPDLLRLAHRLPGHARPHLVHQPDAPQRPPRATSPLGGDGDRRRPRPGQEREGPDHRRTRARRSTPRPRARSRPPSTAR